MTHSASWSTPAPVAILPNVSHELACEEAVDGLGRLAIVAGLLFARYERQRTVRVRSGEGPVCEVRAQRQLSFSAALAARGATATGEDCDVMVSTRPVDPVARARWWVTSDPACSRVTVAARGFSAGQIDVLASQLAQLSASVIDAPDRAVANISLSHATLHDLVRADPPPPLDPCLRPCVRRFEEHAAARPDAVALSFGEVSMKYAELDAHASTLAARLNDLGTQPGDLVGISGRPSFGLVVGILAVHKAGAAYVPLDPVNPSARLATIVEDSGLELVVDCGDGWRPEGVPVLSWHEPGTAPAIGPKRTASPARAGLRDLSYVLYTSGSTGKPKGVRVTHANIARLFSATSHLTANGVGETWTLFHSFGFDFSVWELWGALSRGGRLVIVPYETSRDPRAFVDLLVTEKVTVLSQTPTAFALVATDAVRRPSRPDLALTHVFFGGESLDLRNLNDWSGRYPLGEPTLVNMYGITETSVHVTEHEVGREDLASSVSIIGRPLADLRVYLVDDQGDPVPDGATGEMWVGGPGVASGYVGRRELTQERFIPVKGDPDTVLYRSGDLARRDADGRLQFLGRADQQVKVRGHRIELGEVESAVIEHPDVRGVCVLAQSHRGRNELVAFVVPQDGAVLSRRELFTFVNLRLPSYMIPQRWCVLPHLPLTVNGKVDRIALQHGKTLSQSLNT